MKAHVIAIGLTLTLSLAAGGAVASSWHWAKAPTREEAMRLASDKAQASAERRGTCFKPAVAIDQCQATEDGFRCRADSAEDRSACGVRVGWVKAPALPPALARQRRQSTSRPSLPPPYMLNQSSSSTWELDQFPAPTPVRLP